MRLLAELAELKAVRMDNVIFITTEERADKLRKEEKDMRPSLLDDPNMLVNPPAGFAVPGGIAGPAFRPVPLPAQEDAKK